MGLPTVMNSTCVPYCTTAVSVTNCHIVCYLGTAVRLRSRPADSSGGLGSWGGSRGEF